MQRAPVNAVPACDFGFRNASRYQLARFVELNDSQLPRPPAVSTLRFGNPDAFRLAFTNQRALELGERGKHVQHQLRESVVGIGGVGLPLLDKLHGRTFADDFVDDAPHVA